MSALENLVGLLENLGPAFTALGLVLAVWALAEARRQTKTAAEQTAQLERHEERLRSIWRSLSTRYLGQFPLYSEEIAKLIARAKQRVVICCDLPGYGVLSDRPAWLAIQQAIQTKVAAGVDFDVTVYDEQRRASIIREQMEEAAGGLDAWLASPETRPKLETFVKDYGGLSGLEGLTPEGYLEASAEAHRQILIEAFRGVEVREIDSEIPVYFWMIDGEEAILSIPIFSDHSTEHGFRTSDQSLLAALIDLKGKYLRGPQRRSSS